MRIKTEFPNAICEVEHFWIPLSDGCRLAARRWLPVDAAAHRVPALLYFTPYRLSDSTLPGLTLDQPYLAGHGYAAVCVDVRGTGNSDGLLAGTLSPQEISDGVEVVAWLAAPEVTNTTRPASEFFSSGSMQRIN